MKKFLNSLWIGLTRNADGTFSSTKFWQGIGYIVASWIVVKMSMTGTVSAEIFLIYVGSITAARAFQNFLASKSPAQVQPASTSSASEFDQHQQAPVGSESERP